MPALSQHDAAGTWYIASGRTQEWQPVHTDSRKQFTVKINRLPESGAGAFTAVVARFMNAHAFLDPQTFLAPK